jgi:hypothetical protein
MIPHYTDVAIGVACATVTLALVAGGEIEAKRLFGHHGQCAPGEEWLAGPLKVAKSVCFMSTYIVTAVVAAAAWPASFAAGMFLDQSFAHQVLAAHRVDT